MTESFDENIQEQTRWLKIGQVDFMTFVGKDVVAFAKGCYIVLFNISQKTETVYKANCYNQGEGVQCLVGYQSAYMYAFAENSPCPRIFLVRYPSHEHISVFQDGEKIHSYLAMSFAEMECLVCVMGVPTFEIVVWCWRTGEKLASEPFNLFSLDQVVRCGVSMPIGVGHLCRYENRSTFLMWEIHVCSKFCVLNKTEVKNGLDPGTYVTAFCWSPEGSLCISDTNGNIYMVEEGSLHCNKVCHWPELSPDLVKATVNLLWMKGGVVVSGPDCDVKFFKRTTSSEFVEAWTLKQEGPFIAMAVNRQRDMLAVYTDKATLNQVIMEPYEHIEELKFYGTGFRLLQLIHPTDEYFATVGQNYDLCVWSKETGELIKKVILESVFILDMACNPEMPYLALARSDGAMELFAIYQGTPTSLLVMYLCSEELTGVVFNSSGSLIVVASFKTGRVFVTQGLVGTGRRLKVLDHCLTDQRIVSMMVAETDSDQKLVMIINNEEIGSASGKEVSVYSLPKLEAVCHIKLVREYTEFIQREQSFIGVPYLSRQIDMIEMDLTDGSMNVTGKIMSGHQIRRYHIDRDKAHIITYGWDGLVHLRTVEDMNIFCTIQCHHRVSHGIKMAVVDSEAKYCITLGKEGNIVCTEVLRKCGHLAWKHNALGTYDETYFRRKTVPPSMHSDINAQNKVTWLQQQQQERIDLEAKAAAPDIELIQKEFRALQKELVLLLDKNESLPLEEQLDILEFDLDDDNRNLLLNEAAIERDKLRRLLEAERKDCDRLSEVIKNNSWNLMAVKGRCIKAMLGDFSVENFALPPVDPKFEEELKWVTERRKISLEMSKGDYFQPWMVDPCDSLDEDNTLENENLEDKLFERTESIDKEEAHSHTHSGSSSHKFIPVSLLHSSQFEMTCLFNANSETVLLEKVCADLRIYFNKLFDDMYIRKQREMALLCERNDRLRTILSELEITCHAPLDVRLPDDPTWSQEEQTERIVTITDEEVPEIPYISPSEQDLLDKKAAEEERIRLLLAADNFRERALIVMMDGVLEVRWEDELKKEVPIPKCMIEKEPEDYNEADFKVIKEYEEKCKVLQSERERYRKMLELEYKKLKQTIKESLNKFDAQLFDLFVTKLKIEAAMNQELLKILRIRHLSDKRLRLEIEENEMKKRLERLEKEYDIAMKEVSRLQNAADEARENFDLNSNRDKSLAKKFKSEFHNTNATLGMIDQLAKMFRRRPKIQQRAALYPTLLNELARLVMNPDPNAFIPPEFHDFLRGLNILDQPSNCPSHIDDTIWSTFIHLRRVKVESEHRLKAAMLELAEAETTLNLYTTEMKLRKDKGINQMAELRAAREEKLRRSRDIQMQLVMPMGFIEVPLTGHISDFNSTVLIKRPVVEELNKQVKEAGARKLAAIAAVTNYHRINKSKEWEYLKLKMECEDLETKINNIESVKVTLEVKQVLKNPGKLSEKDFGLVMDAKLLKQVEENYHGVLTSLSMEWDEIDGKVKQCMIANKKVDEEIVNLKCDVSEQILARDLAFEDEIEDISRRRMAAIVKRSGLVKKIQQAHNDIMVLQTELELLRLKTYPTLKYKSVI